MNGAENYATPMANWAKNKHSDKDTPHKQSSKRNGRLCHKTIQTKILIVMNHQHGVCCMNIALGVAKILNIGIFTMHPTVVVMPVMGTLS